VNPIEARPHKRGISRSAIGIDMAGDGIRGARSNRLIARFEATPPGEVVLFLVGMRINRWSRLNRWWPVLSAMRAMLRHLRREPEAGLLAMTATGISNPLVLIQYWQSERHLYDFAHSPRFPHQLAMQGRRDRKATDTSVGLWHECYKIPGEAIRSLYIQMPPTGLGRAYGIREILSASGGVSEPTGVR
jgi:hypothetical protein